MINIKNFTKRFLKEVLLFTDEETKLIMEVQRKFPELLVNKGEFIESARHLYLELGLDETHWSRWIKKNIINNEFFIKNNDWWVLATKANTSKGGHIAKDFKITLEFAKHLSMMQRTEASHKVRSYFILIEKAIKGIKEHELVREPKKQGYNKMKIHINNWCELNGFDNSDDSLTKREANMLNRCLLGMSALDIRYYLGYKDINTREHLEIAINKALSELQLINSSLLIANLDFESRKKIILETCKHKFSDLYIKNKINIITEKIW